MVSIRINIQQTVNVEPAQAVELMQALAIVERFAADYAEGRTESELRRMRRRRRRGGMRLTVTAECTMRD